jgi:hypothetical protein
MVISYNQNMYFKIQCRKSINIIIISFLYIIKNSHNNKTMKIIAKVCTYLVYWKLQSKYSKSSMVYWNEIKTTRLNMWYIKNIIYSFGYKVPTSAPLFQNCVSKNENPCPITFIFGQFPSHHQHDSKPNKNSKFKPLMSNDQSLSLMSCSFKIM